MDTDTRYINQIEVITNIFTIDKGKINILLFRRIEDPYKGYWMLPSNLLMTSETINNCASDTIHEWAGIKDAYIEQCNVFSNINRLPNDRIIGNSVIALVDYQTIKFKKENRKNSEYSWFSIDDLPKMVFDYNEIAFNASEFIKRKILNSNILRKFYPADFTFPELQHVYEQALGKELDRRNFRKKFLNFNFIEKTGYKISSGNGRPATLYRFKEEEINYNLF
ncbi:MAG: NUDIX hydrolase [Bacilli bacterium]